MIKQLGIIAVAGGVTMALTGFALILGYGYNCLIENDMDEYSDEYVFSDSE